jgi:hypothetical protein
LAWLIAEFKRVNFLSLRDSELYGEKCPAGGGDGAHEVLTFSLNGRSKVVCYESIGVEDGIVRRLAALARAVDKAANAKRWVS